MTTRNRRELLEDLVAIIAFAGIAVGKTAKPLSALEGGEGELPVGPQALSVDICAAFSRQGGPGSPVPCGGPLGFYTGNTQGNNFSGLSGSTVIKPWPTSNNPYFTSAERTADEVAGDLGTTLARMQYIAEQSDMGALGNVPQGYRDGNFVVNNFWAAIRGNKKLARSWLYAYHGGSNMRENDWWGVALRVDNYHTSLGTPSSDGGFSDYHGTRPNTFYSLMGKAVYNIGSPNSELINNLREVCERTGFYKYPGSIWFSEAAPIHGQSRRGIALTKRPSTKGCKHRAENTTGFVTSTNGPLAMVRTMRGMDRIFYRRDTSGNDAGRKIGSNFNLWTDCICGLPTRYARIQKAAAPLIVGATLLFELAFLVFRYGATRSTLVEGLGEIMVMNGWAKDLVLAGELVDDFLTGSSLSPSEREGVATGLLHHIQTSSPNWPPPRPVDTLAYYLVRAADPFQREHYMQTVRAYGEWITRQGNTKIVVNSSGHGVIEWQ